jgi:hypothetical protein
MKAAHMIRGLFIFLAMVVFVIVLRRSGMDSLLVPGPSLGGADAVLAAIVVAVLIDLASNQMI